MLVSKAVVLATPRVSGSISEIESSSKLATQIPPSPAEIAAGRAPTGTSATTSRCPGR